MNAELVPEWNNCIWYCIVLFVYLLNPWSLFHPLDGVEDGAPDGRHRSNRTVGFRRTQTELRGSKDSLLDQTGRRQWPESKGKYWYFLLSGKRCRHGISYTVLCFVNHGVKRKDEQKWARLRKGLWFTSLLSKPDESSFYEVSPFFLNRGSSI